MKKTFRLVFLSALALCFTGFLAAQTSHSVKEWLKGDEVGQKPRELLVYGTETINWDSLNLVWDGDNIAYRERSPLILELLQDRSNRFKDKLVETGSSIEIVEELSLLNAFILRGSQDVMNESILPIVAFMEFPDEQVITPHLPVGELERQQRSPNGSEPGLDIINVRPLWDLGYSGRGLVMMSVDAGIWEDHPSFGNRFLGKHRPIDQAWMKYDLARPGDKRSSHGTHTTGTVLGLDTSTHDTIGVAFNAYFMASDPIVSVSSDIRPMWEIAATYAWALNPDGDSLTTQDMPHVINNSWGHTFDPINDSVVCNGFYRDMLIALESAGIIYVQSAGNDGPGAGTVGSPATGAVSLVNNFAVGAIQLNSSHTIASFSSRGPGICDGTGALKIKPEVVAPGVNIRSAVRNDDGSFDYGNFQGTSMAGPHVAGACLLLREAFPIVSAESIKEALYYTAIDLGDPGEDNTYGNGLIDVYAAYQYLAQTNTPALPGSSPLDLAITDINLDTIEATCQRIFIPEITFRNSQQVMQGMVQVIYGFEGEPLRVYNPGSSGIAPNETITLDTITSEGTGFKEFYAEIMYLGAMEEIDYLNNRKYARFHVYEPQALPFFEFFDDVNLYRSGWYVDDPDNKYGWDTVTVNGLKGLNHSARSRMARYTYRQSQLDGMSIQLEAPQSGDFTLAFDLSYQFKVSVFNDSLKVLTSTDCGESWTPVYNKGEEEINTTDKAIQNEFIPVDSADWRTDTIDLSALAGSGAFLLKFETKNRGGNNLYIDNVRVWAGDWASIDEQHPIGVQELILYPNPVVDGILRVEGFSNDSYRIMDLAGHIVQTGRSAGSIDVSSLSSGMYVLEDKGRSGRFVIR